MHKLITAAAATVFLVSVSPVSASAMQQHHQNTDEDDVKVTICRATDSSSHPYMRKTVFLSDPDEDEGYKVKKGELFTTGAKKWGDIVPANSMFEAGQNWTAEGQAVYNNDCQVPEDEDNDDVANITATATCSTTDGKSTTTVTLTNDGEADGVATVNDSEVSVLAGQTVTQTVSGSQVVVTFNDETVLDEELTCTPGQGSGTTDVTPATPVAATPVASVQTASLPDTGLNTAAAISLLAGAAAAVVAVSHFARQGYRKFFKA